MLLVLIDLSEALDIVSPIFCSKFFRSWGSVGLLMPHLPLTSVIDDNWFRWRITSLTFRWSLQECLKTQCWDQCYLVFTLHSLGHFYSLLKVKVDSTISVLTTLKFTCLSLHWLWLVLSAKLNVSYKKSRDGWPSAAWTWMVIRQAWLITSKHLGL